MCILERLYRGNKMEKELEAIIVNNRARRAGKTLIRARLTEWAKPVPAFPNGAMALWSGFWADSWADAQKINKLTNELRKGI